jgi:putative ABC transport system permease protein
MAYLTQARRYEMAVRLALGADPGRLVRLSMGRGLVLTAAGLVAGIATSLAATRVFSRLVYGVTTTDPLTFIACAGLFSGVALVSCYLPARQATGVDAVTLLRS